MTTTSKGVVMSDKLIKIDVLRVNRARAKVCTCKRPQYEIDTTNHLVQCMKCGAIVEPFTALEHLALHSERLDKYVDNINAHIKKLLERVKELDNYKPRLRVIKELEQRYRKCNKDRLNPTCPKCGMAFELEEILSTIWTIREGVER